MFGKKITLADLELKDEQKKRFGNTSATSQGDMIDLIEIHRILEKNEEGQQALVRLARKYLKITKRKQNQRKNIIEIAKSTVSSLYGAK